MENLKLHTNYTEKKIRNTSYYEKNITDEYGNEVSARQVSCTLMQNIIDGITVFILYDEYMKPISSVYEFLNYDIADKPLTTRKQYAHALRLLYCFLTLFSYKVNEIDSQCLSQLTAFLKGLGTSDNEDITQRSNITVNNYLAVYRNYFEKQEIKGKPLFSAKNKTFALGFSEHDIINETTTYKNNLRATKANERTVPKYISPSDFRKVYGLAVKNKDTLSQIIMHLMYGYGLRLGEVLGITIEDIQEVHQDNKLIPVIILRNRLSDKTFQYAKCLPHVTNSNGYKTRDYSAASQKIVLTYDFYEKLLEYIDESHTEYMEKYPKAYAAGISDAVSQRNAPASNHYVFLNRLGRVLSNQTWGNILKGYFTEAGIPIDSDIRENNLSHRFRHGFAMFHARYSERSVDALVLQKMMRHKSISSTMVYYNPTPEDELKIKTEFQEELYNMIPELRSSMKEAFDTDDNE